MTQRYNPGNGPTPKRDNPGSKSSVPRKKDGSSKRIANHLVALSSAAILSVYGMGYFRTQAAENQILALQNPGVVAASPATPAVSTIVPMATSTLTSVPPTNTPVPTNTAAPTVTARRLGLTSREGSGFRERDGFGERDDGRRLRLTTGAAPANVVPSTALPVNTPTAAVPAVPTAAPPTPNTPASASSAATAVPVAPAATATPAKTGKYRDGTYVAMGYSRHGDIQATVVIKSGKIVSADITQCLTRYPCSMVSSLPGQVITNQAPPVDLVSGATYSSMAYQEAVSSALSKAT